MSDAAYLGLQGRALLKRTEDGQTAGPLFKTLYGMHAIPLAFALLLQLGYNAQQFAGPLLLKKITTFLTNSAYIQQVLFIFVTSLIDSATAWFVL